ncbi:MAG: NADH-quinone oxidoreductase subunit NuoE [Desulfomonilia bacterium]
MLGDDERKEIAAEIERFEDQRGACVEALKIVQRHRGFVSDEALRDIAPLLGMTMDELDGIATFYSFIFRKPVGRHMILVCDSVSCWVMGYEEILAHLKERLGIGFGETTGDGRFTLLPVSCIGSCHHAPALMVDGRLYGDLDIRKIDEILASYT